MRALTYRSDIFLLTCESHCFLVNTGAGMHMQLLEECHGLHECVMILESA